MDMLKDKRNHNKIPKPFVAESVSALEGHGIVASDDDFEVATHDTDLDKNNLELNKDNDVKAIIVV